MIKVSLSGNTIYLGLFSMKECDAIRPEYNCFISMIISVNTLCGFAPLGTLCILVFVAHIYKKIYKKDRWNI